MTSTKVADQLVGEAGRFIQMKKFLGFLILCGGGFFMFVALVGSKHGQDEPAAASRVMAIDDAPPLQVNAETLFSAYKRNEIAADELYKGRILEVEGRVSQIRKDFTGAAILELVTENRFETVDAHLKEDSVSFAGTLSPGFYVTVLCRGNGMIVGSPMLKDCSIK
jgi:hypothetical protein